MSDEVQAGQGLSARMWNALVRSIRRSRPLQGAGILITQTPAGTLIAAAGSASDEFLLARVVAVNGDHQSAPAQNLPSTINYTVRIPTRPDLEEVTFSPADIDRGVKADAFKVWPMPIGTWVCIKVTPTDDPAKPIRMILAAIEAPYTEVCGG